MLKVLHVIPSVSLKHGGPTYALQAFARASEEQGVDVVIATTDDDGGRRRLRVPFGEAFEHRGVQHIFFRRDVLSYKISFGLARWLSTNVSRFDLVHIHALFSFSSYAAARAARKHKIPYIVRPLGVLNRWGMQNRRPLVKRLSLSLVELPILRHAAAIHYTSEAERNEAAALRPEISSFPSFILPIPVESPPEPVDAESFAKEFPSASGKKSILFLSRLDPKKGLEILIEAFAAISESEPDALLVLAGDGNPDYVQSLRTLADRLGAKAKILWPGHLGPKQKAAAFAAATLFVLPSYSENFGIAAAEALAAGVPTILSDQVALAGDFAKHDAALVVPPEKHHLEEALRRVLSDQTLRQNLQDKGRAIAAKLYSPEAVGAELAQQYRQICER